MSQTALILGASGRFGRHMAEAFWNAGWQVRLFDRQTDTLRTAADGVDVIVNGWNPPYTDWAREVPALTDRVISTARATGATVILPGNVYVFGRDADPLLNATTPHNATNPLGRIRVEMEAAYRAASIQTIVLRGGDFIDTEASGNWFDLIVAAKSAKGVFTSPGDPNVAHAWAYLPDMARAAVALAEKRAQLETFEDVPFPGYTLSLTELAGLVEQATGTPQKVKRMNWLPLFAAYPFWTMGRKLIEMRYLWSMPHQLDDSRLAALLPDFKPTDPLTAIGEAIAHLDIHPDQPVARGQSHVAAE